ncbi:MAG TPA: hypothetical protein VN203_22985 [Candidatus Acidoferrum sp.]|nr:hypothetical protein [Candidatus Acidoferrum sp.]
MARLVELAVILSLGLGLVNGCASSTSEGWTKPGMTREQLGRDTSECLLDASKMVTGPGGSHQVVDQPRYRNCMAGRGYTVAPTK